MAKTNIKKVSLGGNLSYVVGNFTHTEGAAHKTFAISAGIVYGFQVLSNTADGVTDITGNAPMSYSTSGGIMTITFAGNAEITDDTFSILVGN